MFSNDLKKSLSEKYDILCFEDLGILMANPSGIYPILSRQHREVFTPSQRLVFYSQAPLTRSVIFHMQKAVSLIDISNFFVIICCPNNINQLLSDAAATHGYDDSQMSFYLASISDAVHWQPESYVESDSLCPIPWMNMTFFNQGDIKPCCVYSKKIGNIHDNIDDIFHGTEYQNLRREMLLGQRPKSCRACWQQEKYGTKSHRQLYLDTVGREFLTHYIDNPEMVCLDIKAGMTCNMKCRICDEKQSSLWASEQMSYGEDPDRTKIIIEQSKWTEQDNLWSKLLDKLPRVINLEFYGGEPFLNKQLVHLIDRCIEKNLSKNIRLHVNTNGSIWPETLIEKMKLFKSIDIAFSIDDIGDRFEIQRGGQWSDVVSVIERFKSVKSFHVYVYATVSIQNILYLRDLIDWADSFDLPVIISVLDTPRYLNINFMTPQAKSLVIQTLEHDPDTRIKSLVARIKDSPGNDGVEFIQFQSRLDNIRRQSFKSCHQEIVNAMGDSV